MNTVSLISCHINPDSSVLKSLKELDVFMTKFNISLEVLLIVDNASKNFVENANQIKLNSIVHQFQFAQKKMGRPLSMKTGIEIAKGNQILFFDLNGNCNFSDMISMIFENLSSTMSATLGNRYNSRKMRQTSHHSTWHQTLEKIIIEKWRLRNPESGIFDPLSPYICIPRELASVCVNSLKFKKWYMTPDILELCLQRKIQISQVPIHSRDTAKSNIPIIREYLFQFF